MTPDWSDLRDSNAVIVGATRRGKTGLLHLMARATVARGLDGVTWLDPHGGCRELAEWLANPAHGHCHRAVHILDPASTSTFALNPLEPYDDSWEAAHDAANTLAAVIESRFEASAEETPRLARIVYVAGVLIARKKLTLLELLELLSLGGRELRERLLSDFENTIVRRELSDLHELARAKPHEFLLQVESTRNRLVRWLGDGGRLMRILSQKSGLNPRAVMNGRDIVLADLSSLTYSDAAFIGTLLTSMYFAAARRRPPLRSPRHRIILDEAESLITADVARMTDQCAKYGLNLIAAIQRLGQLRAKGPYIADALFTNASVKVAFGGLEPESAEYMARLLFTGHLDLIEWKESKRPVAVGQIKRMVHSSSISEHVADHETFAITQSYSRGEAFGTMTAESTGTADFTGSGESSGLVMNPPYTLFGPNAPNASFLQMPLSESQGDSTSAGSSKSSASSSGSSHVEVETAGQAISHGHGSSRGTSRTEGTSEVFVTDYQWLDTQMYSLEEQLHRHTGLLMNLPRRECLVKIEDAPPFRMRTPDLTPAFRSSLFKAAMMPLFLSTSAAKSRYLIATDKADAAIAARIKDLIAPEIPEPDLTPEPFPLVNAPEEFARDFWKKRGKPPRKSKPNLRLIDNDPDGDKGKK